ncbi:hypothetical protein AURANDRAFT_14410, partial [Aureococcus anophagefferens]
DVAVLELDDADTLNAMSASLLAGLARRVREASASTARAVVLQASGPHFCTGGRYAGKPGAAPWWLKARGVYGPSVVLDAYRRLPLASTTVCHGTSVGGGFLLGIAADLRVSTVSARFRLGVSPHGLTPVLSATVILPEMIGGSLAVRLYVEDALLDAEAARGSGIVHRV